jgi:hypothetical protein
VRLTWRQVTREPGRVADQLRLVLSARDTRKAPPKRGLP